MIFVSKSWNNRASLNGIRGANVIIVDECHRGSARDDSKWCEILEYFKGATHVGLESLLTTCRALEAEIEHFPHSRRPAPPGRAQRSLRLIEQQWAEFLEHSSSLINANLVLSELAKISVDQCSKTFLLLEAEIEHFPHSRRPAPPGRAQRSLRLIEQQWAEFLEHSSSLINANLVLSELAKISVDQCSKTFLS